MQLHELQPIHTQKSKKRVGRGGKRGKTSGRGHKGQNARAGNSSRPEMREHIKKLPKLRGFGINRAKTVHSGRVTPHIVNLADIEAHHDTGEVTPRSLCVAGIIHPQAKRAPKVKILGDGEITKSFAVSGCAVSQSAREKIEAAGGSVTLP